jgi:hypothetical protein
MADLLQRTGSAAWCHSAMAGPLENKAGTAADQPSGFTFTFRALCEGQLGNGLPTLELQPTGLTFVFIRWHDLDLFCFSPDSRFPQEELCGNLTGVPVKPAKPVTASSFLRGIFSKQKPLPLPVMGPRPRGPVPS